MFLIIRKQQNYKFHVKFFVNVDTMFQQNNAKPNGRGILRR